MVHGGQAGGGKSSGGRTSDSSPPSATHPGRPRDPSRRRRGSCKPEPKRTPPRSNTTKRRFAAIPFPGQAYDTSEQEAMAALGPRKMLSYHATPPIWSATPPFFKPAEQLSIYCESHALRRHRYFFWVLALHSSFLKKCSKSKTALDRLCSGQAGESSSLSLRLPPFFASEGRRGGAFSVRGMK